VVAPSFAVSLESIESVNGKTNNVAGELKRVIGQDVTLQMKAVDGAPAQSVIIHVARDLNADFINGTGEGAGVIQLASPDRQDVVVLNPIEAVIESTREIWFVSTATLQSLGQMIAGTRSAKELGGIIRIGAVTGDAAQQGFLAVLLLAAMLSINLGLINLLPIPMLDGGHLLFYAIEALKGKPIPEKIQDAALRVGFFVLIALMIFSNVNDVVQLSR
jgi:regulator of sigma E protease